MLYKIYIGSNNQTHKLEKTKAIAIASKSFEGFTVQNASGYWQGLAENTLTIEIETDDKARVITLATELREALNQQAIGLASIGSMVFI